MKTETFYLSFLFAVLFCSSLYAQQIDENSNRCTVGKSPKIPQSQLLNTYAYCKTGIKDANCRITGNNILCEKCKYNGRYTCPSGGQVVFNKNIIVTCETKYARKNIHVFDVNDRGKVLSHFCYEGNNRNKIVLDE